MKTYTQIKSENTTVIGGIDKFGAKGDLLQVTTENNHGQDYYRVYFLCENDEHPLKSFSSEKEAIDACRKVIRSLRMPIANVNMKQQIFSL